MPLRLKNVFFNIIFIPEIIICHAVVHFCSKNSTITKPVSMKISTEFQALNLKRPLFHISF
nr:MAG TPA: hypothetical protein [Caudoviricetes sp.]